MTKQKRILPLLLFMLVSILLLTTGCKRNQVSVYTLPLGDSGYISEIDFKTKESYAYSYTDSGVVKEWVSYNYLEVGKTYTLHVELGKSEKAGKSIKLVAGYYNEGEFTKYSESEYIVNESDSFAQGELEFTVTHENSIVKIVFGTNLDEAKAKADNPNAKKSEINKIVKNYKGSSLVVRKLYVVEAGQTDEINILSKPVLDEAGNETGIRVGSVSTDLTYYNTAVVQYNSEPDQDSLLLTLNFKGGVWQWIITQIGVALNWITQLVGGSYWLGLLIMTILIRSAAWPIYAKSNSMTSRMSEVQPEIDKINKKYEGKTDQNSQMKKQMETREVMKKNHVSMFGCLLPFLQMPIFLWVYQVVQRFPITPAYEATTNFKFLWTTFGTEYGQATGDWILAIIVGLTMIASQLLSTYMTKRANAKKKNFYTQNKQKSSNNQMMIMMVVMTAMMVYFAWRSAGIAFYWIIGNTYQIFQTYVSKKQEERKADKAQLASGKPRGRN